MELTWNFISHPARSVWTWQVIAQSSYSLSWKWLRKVAFCHFASVNTEGFTHILQCHFIGIETTIWLFQCQWKNPQWRVWVDKWVESTRTYDIVTLFSAEWHTYKINQKNMCAYFVGYIMHEKQTHTGFTTKHTFGAILFVVVVSWFSMDSCNLCNHGLTLCAKMVACNCHTFRFHNGSWWRHMTT